MHANRKAFRKANRSFELYRKRFYRTLNDDGEKTAETKVPIEDIRQFWSSYVGKRRC